MQNLKVNHTSLQKEMLCESKHYWSSGVSPLGDSSNPTFLEQVTAEGHVSWSMAWLWESSQNYYTSSMKCLLQSSSLKACF